MDYGRKVTPLSANETLGLPWASRRTFRIWRYGVGHSQLLIRSPGNDSERTLDLIFEGVEFLRLRRSYDGLTLSFAGEDSSEEFVDAGLPSIRLLRLLVSSSSGTGLVACSRLTVAEALAGQDEREVAAGEEIISVIA